MVYILVEMDKNSGKRARKQSKIFETPATTPKTPSAAIPDRRTSVSSSASTAKKRKAAPTVAEAAEDDMERRRLELESKLSYLDLVIFGCIFLGS